MLRQPSFEVMSALGVDDLRIDQHDLGLGIFLEGDVDDGDALADADLRSGQAHAMRGVHALEHVVGQLAQLVVELGDGGGRLLQYRVAKFHDGIDHLEVSQSAGSSLRNFAAAPAMESPPNFSSAQRASVKRHHGFAGNSGRGNHAYIASVRRRPSPARGVAKSTEPKRTPQRRNRLQISADADVFAVRDSAFQAAGMIRARG